MFSIQNLFSKADKFFDLLEESAAQVHQTVTALMEVLSSKSPQIELERFTSVELRDKKITEEINELLVETFVTGLEREDIQALSSALYKITKTVEKFAERFKATSSYHKEFDFGKQAGVIASASSTLVEMVHSLRKIPKLDKIKKLKDKLDEDERSADAYISELLASLYSGKHEAVTVVVVRDLYDLLEKIVDRCRDASDEVYQIVLKNS